MFTLYAIALFGVCAAMLFMLVDAVLSVSRKPQWEVRRVPVMLVETIDHREQQLPYVGVERRRSGIAAAAISEDRHVG